MRNIYVVKAKLATCGLLEWIRSKTENSRKTLRNTYPCIHQWHPKTLYLIMDSREITSSTKRLFFQVVAPKRWMQKQWMTEKSFHALILFFKFKVYIRGLHVNCELRYIERPFFHCDEGGQLTSKNQWKNPKDLMNNQSIFNKIISGLPSFSTDLFSLLRSCFPPSVPLLFYWIQSPSTRPSYNLYS